MSKTVGGPAGGNNTNMYHKSPLPLSAFYLCLRSTCVGYKLWKSQVIHSNVCHKSYCVYQEYIVLVLHILWMLQSERKKGF